MLNNLLLYFSFPGIQVAVLCPGAISVAWLFQAWRKQDVLPEVLVAWMVSVVAAYLSSRWVIEGDLRQLYITPAFLVFAVTYLYCRRSLTPLTGFSLTFLGLWVVDMARAYQLVGIGETDASTFYFGVGGAGSGDGLYYFPLAAAFLVMYVKRRQMSALRARGEPGYFNGVISPLPL